jgi:hypothetical protein
MTVKSNEEFLEALEWMDYEASFPWDRFFINRERRKAGLPPLRVRPW